MSGVQRWMGVDTMCAGMKWDDAPKSSKYAGCCTTVLRGSQALCIVAVGCVWVGDGDVVFSEGRTKCLW